MLDRFANTHISVLGCDPQVFALWLEPLFAKSIVRASSPCSQASFGIAEHSIAFVVKITGGRSLPSHCVSLRLRPELVLVGISRGFVSMLLGSCEH